MKRVILFSAPANSDGSNFGRLHVPAGLATADTFRATLVHGANHLHVQLRLHAGLRCYTVRIERRTFLAGGLLINLKFKFELHFFFST